MRPLLDGDLLSGPEEVNAALRPLCVARCVEHLSDAKEVIAHLCQTWGGASNPLVPAFNGQIPRYLSERLAESEVDGFRAPPNCNIQIPFLKTEGPWDYPAALIVAHDGREGMRPVDIVSLEPDDPWLLPYLGALGWMPRELSDDTLCFQGGVKAIDVDKVIPIEQTSITGSLGDLLGRVASFDKLTPRSFSTLHLASGSRPHTGYMGGDRILPSRWSTATAAGPNIVVVMSPDSFEDLSLLWNLRAQWGDARALPLGVPRDQMDITVLRKLQEPGLVTRFGFGGGHLYLVSETVSLDNLKELAQGASAVEVAEPAELVRFGAAPCRPRSQVHVWANGVARVPAMTDSDRTVLAATSHSRPSLRLSVAVPRAPIPSVPTLRGDFYYDYQSGRAIVQASSLETDIPEVHWPTGWTCLSASALTHKLDVRESQPGIAAMNLIRALGAASDIWYLCDGQLIALLYRLAERSGMSWWKRRWERVEQRLKAEGKSAEDIEAFAYEAGRDEPAIAGPNEGRHLAFQDFRRCFGRSDATQSWLAWAVERRLLVQGVELNCPRCRAPFWLPVQEVGPPHTCPGCGRVLENPFRSDIVDFKYRIGEVLRKCLELDSLGHVLALRWLSQLFERRGLVGAHPGVEFLRNNRVIAETDVILLFEDGGLVPVEVKRRASGFTEQAARALDSVSLELGAPYDIVCVTESQKECAGLLKFQRSLPDRPRFLLTLEALLERQVLWALGANPFEVCRSEIADSKPPQDREQWLKDVSEIGSRPADWSQLTVDSWRDTLWP